jgi:hypothetical protein
MWVADMLILNALRVRLHLEPSQWFGSIGDKWNHRFPSDCIYEQSKRSFNGMTDVAPFFGSTSPMKMAIGLPKYDVR